MPPARETATIDPMPTVTAQLVAVKVAYAAPDAACAYASVPSALASIIGGAAKPTGLASAQFH